MSDPLKQLLASRGPGLVRPAWKPVKAAPSSRNTRNTRNTRSSSNTQKTWNSQGSRFGGCRPYRRPGFRWPRCGECSHQKAFLCQVEGRSLPPLARELTHLKNGLLQVFLCLECLPYEGVFDDVEVVQGDALVPSLQGLAATALAEAEVGLHTLPEKLILEVRVFTEQFSAQEGQDLLEEVEVESWEMKGGREEEGEEVPSMTEIQDAVELEDLDDVDEAPAELVLLPQHRERQGRKLGWAGTGVKIGGWVNWCQSPEYPTCPDCKVAMTVPLLQMEEDDGILAFGWGDAGTAHVTLCPACHRPGLGWACC